MLSAIPGRKTPHRWELNLTKAHSPRRRERPIQFVMSQSQQFAPRLLPAAPVLAAPAPSPTEPLVIPQGPTSLVPDELRTHPNFRTNGEGPRVAQHPQALSDRTP